MDLAMALNASQSLKDYSSWAGSTAELTESERRLMERETLEMYARAKAIVFAEPRRYSRKKVALAAAE
jgi:hypothetical protein